MKSRKLLAAVTASGAMLSFSFCAEGNAPTLQTTGDGANALPRLVEQLKAKLHAASPAGEQGGAGQRIEHVVQFFNFLNCQRPDRPGWKNC
jgi:hypothetical protein